MRPSFPSIPALARAASRGASAAIVLLALAGGAAPAFGQVVISQIYGGGGNSGATYTNDFVELFNRGSTPVSLAGWSVQYASTAGTTWQTTPITGSIPPGGYYLVQQSAGTGGTTPLPTPDATGTIPMSATAGKVALVSSTAALTGACPTGGAIVDFVGFGPATNCAEAAPTTANLSNTTAAFRAANGCTDSNNNAADFSVAGPAPRNGASPAAPCGVPTNQPIATSCGPLGAVAGVGASRTIGASDPDGRVVSATISSGGIAGIGLFAVTPAPGAGGALAATLTADASVPIGSYPIVIAFANDDVVPQTATCGVTVTVTAASGSVRIRDIQGRAHISPLNGQAVSSVPGIVTARANNGFWFQDPSPDADPATSEGIFVFTSSAPTVAVGDAVVVSGTVSEFRPGGNTTGNLTTTEIVTPTVVVLSSGNPLPAPVVIGAGGRIPPGKVIDDDATGNVETSGSFDPATDGIDFYESLEGMRVQINTAVAVGPTNSFGEIAVVGDGGANASRRSARGGIVIAPDDFNPERIILDDTLAPMPQVKVGDSAAVVIGVLDYSFGNFKLLPSVSPAFTSGGLAPESTVAQGPNQLAIAAFNVENLDPSDGAPKFAALAQQIVQNLRSPDIIALTEVQDNNGATNDAVVDASVTLNTLINAIVAAGGPSYLYRQIDPVDDTNGGEPGGNIRVAFLFNPARVAFVDRPGGGPTIANAVDVGAFGPQLRFSPGLLDPTNAAFNTSRKPLAGEFLFKGHRLFLIGNHFNSKGGDQPLFGRAQPPERSSEVQRGAQAAIVAGFVQSLLATDPAAKVVVLGDLNDFEFSPALATLKAVGLVDLVESLPPEERYTYVFDGNSQVLDHILVSSALATGAAPEYDIVHINAEFTDRTSDHDPEVVRLALPTPEVTAQVSTAQSGLVFNRATQRFTGTITVTNNGPRALVGPIHVRLDGLTAGVTLANATGTSAGAPYVSAPVSSLGAGASTTVPVQFVNPSRGPLGYVARTFSGAF